MVAIPAFLSPIIGFFSPIFAIFRSRPRQSASDQYLDDVGAIMDDDYYKRDIVIAGKRMTMSPYLYQRINAVRDIGHIAWLGGPAVAKFASSHLMEFSRILVDKDSPIDLKKQTLFTIIEVCVGMRENQDKARWNGLLETLYILLDCPVPVLRRGATACMAVLISENYENYAALVKMEKMKEKLLRVLHDDWRAWKRNEAARLILMLGLSKVIDEEDIRDNVNAKG